jgi:hypothetical protein
MVNWRDPFTDVVHIVNYGNIENENMWTKHSYQRETERAMVCGLSVSVTRDGLIKREEALVLLPWTHTREHPTCLACVGGVRSWETLRWDPDGPDDADELDDEENDDPLDGGSTA